MFTQLLLLQNPSCKITLTLLALFCNSQLIFSQNKNTTVANKQVYEEKNVDNKPEYQGGAIEINKFIAANYKMPDIDSYNGKVIITFIVETDGTLSDFNVVKDIGYGSGDEAIRIFKKSPAWKPAILDGKQVRTLVSFSITLKSEED